MARGKFTTSNYHFGSGAPATLAYPYSMVVWCRTDSDTGTDPGIAFGVKDNSNDSFYCTIGFRRSTNTVRFFHRCTTFKEVFSTSSYVNDTWHLFGGIARNQNIRLAILDDEITSSTSSSAGTGNPNVQDSIHFGAYKPIGAASNACEDEWLAWPCIWSGYELTADDCASMAGGTHPIGIRPDKIWWLGQDQPDANGDILPIIGSPKLTETGSVAQVGSPLLARGRVWVPDEVAAAPATGVIHRLAGAGGLAGPGGIAGPHGGLAG